MYSFNPMFLVFLIVGPLFSLMGFILLKFPPKKINRVYGYRTKNSMQSQEKWDYAQVYSAKEMIKTGGIVTGLSLSGFLLKMNETGNMIVIILTMTVISFVLVYRTEKALRKKFGEVAKRR